MQGRSKLGNMIARIAETCNHAVLILLALMIASSLYAQGDLATSSPDEVPDELNAPAAPPPTVDDPGQGIEVVFGGPQMFYDARSIGMDRKNNRSMFEGNVVVIGAGTMLTADKVTVDHKKGELQAEGHVVLLTPKQVFTGDAINFHWVTGDFKLVQAVMSAFSPDDVDRLSRELLGFTPAELEFEQKRQLQISSVQGRKGDFRRQVRQTVGPEKTLDDDTIDRYALILEQEDIIRRQENPSLARMGLAKKEGYLKRRQFWERARTEALERMGKGPESAAYFKISGAELSRTNGNDYLAYNSTWTPCKCDDDESPAWGFRADRIHAQVEGYADMEHPVLEIKGFPVLYLPFLKVPLKQRRQSGFLMPTISSGNQYHGNVYTQPVFFAFAPHWDSTFTTDIYQNRGTRLGAELRYEQRRYSGWTLKLENIRDRVWIDQRRNRELLDERTFGAGGSCDGLAPGDAAYDANSCADKKERYRVPSNTWRHAQEWQGQTFLAPRLSFVSHGKVRSDHRYMEDLNLPDSFEEAFGMSAAANAFSTAKGQFHLDGKDYYLGLGANFGDHALMNQRFKGYQTPAQVTVMSRTYDILPAASPMPLYANLTVEQKTIRDYTTSEPGGTAPLGELGSGHWQRAVVDAVSPISTQGAVTVDYFAQGEVREIQASGLPDQNSQIASWRTGFAFRLPLDGIGLLPDIWQPDDWADDGAGKRYLHHLMNWNLIFSTRPSVRRRGDYGELPSSVYFGSDRKAYQSDNDDAVRLENSMVPHRMVTLATNHRWRIYRKGWSLAQDPAETGEEPHVPLSYRERSRQELLKALEQPPIPSDEFMVQTLGTGVWQGQNFQVRQYDEQEPVQWNADISYDAIQERNRQKTIDNNRLLEQGQIPADGQQAIVRYPDLPKSWIGPNSSLAVNYASFTLGNTVRYNMYLRTYESMGFSLGLPQYAATRLGVGYTVDKDPQQNPDNPDQFDYLLTRVRTLSLTTTLIPWVTTRASWAKKSVANGTKDSYETRLGWEYLSSSGCWGLRFLRSKDFAMDERDATYILQLSVIFMGQQRGQDVGAPFVREFRNEDAG